MTARRVQYSMLKATHSITFSNFLYFFEIKIFKVKQIKLKKSSLCLGEVISEDLFLILLYILVGIRF